MTSLSVEQIQQAVRDHVQEEVECRSLGDDAGRIGCVTPLEMPDGDNVVVWIQQREGVFEVTDYGESLADSAPYRGPERRSVEDFAVRACRGHGIEYVEGRLTTRADLAGLGDAVWRLGTAAAEVAQAAAIFRPVRRRREENEFVSEVERTLQEKDLAVERERRIVGRSGHKHRATIFIPATDAILEPISGNMNQVNATYTKFGDLMNTNGFALYSLLDDRAAEPDEDVAGLLVQVGKVIAWSRRDEWLDAVTVGRTK